MRKHSRNLLLVLFASPACVIAACVGPLEKPEDKAVKFLTREVPAWPKNNGCFSCHNNGDAARALFAATRKGYRIPKVALAGTTVWLLDPLRWDKNKGNPGFSDQTLADIQFSAALCIAQDTGLTKKNAAIAMSARKLAAVQDMSGAWIITPAASAGSPATYGTSLATYMALTALSKVETTVAKVARRKGAEWLKKSQPRNTIEISAVLQANAAQLTHLEKIEEQSLLRRLMNSTHEDGGWGSYKDSPSEPFDTALALLAIKSYRDGPELKVLTRRARRFLARIQDADGGWPATTRPAGGDSYAQRISTTAWALIALLETRD